MLWCYIENKGRIHLKKLNPKTIYKILDGIQVSEKASGERIRNAVFKMLKSILNKGYKWGYIDDNPCNRLDTPKYKAKEKETLHPDNLNKIIVLLGNEELKHQACFYFGFLCGLRRQEIIGLTWDNIDFENKSFRITQGAIRVKGEKTKTKGTKTAKSIRTLHLPDILYNILKKMKSEQKERRLRLGDRWKGQDWIFTQWDGSIMAVDTPSKWWYKFRDKNNLGNVTFHGLRHTAATFMLKNNIPVPTVSAVLGHASITTTLNTYAHVIEDTKEEAITSMENMVLGQNKS